MTPLATIAGAVVLVALAVAFRRHRPMRRWRIWVHIEHDTPDDLDDDA